MIINKSFALSILLASIFISGCSTPVKQVSAFKSTPIPISVNNLYMNHIDMTPSEFHTSSKLIFKSFFKDYKLSFHDDMANSKESLLSTEPFEISKSDLIKYGFVDDEYVKGRMVGVSRSVLHPYTNKVVTGYGFFLHGWNGEKWFVLESNRMYEQLAYNIIQDILQSESDQKAGEN